MCPLETCESRRDSSTKCCDRKYEAVIPEAGAPRNWFVEEIDVFEIWIYDFIYSLEYAEMCNRVEYRDGCVEWFCWKALKYMRWCVVQRECIYNHNHV